jgi:hypothetical protein
VSRCQAEEKLIELAEIRRAYEGETELAAKNRSLLDARATSALIHRAGIKSRSEKIGESDIKRRSPRTLRYSFTPSSLGRRNDWSSEESTSSPAEEASLGEPRLRPQNSWLVRGAGVVGQYGHCRAKDSGG